MSRRVTLALLPVFALALATPAADKEKEKEVDPVRKKAAEKRFKKLEEYCKERRVTHVVELMVEWREYADHDQRQEVLGMANAIFDDVVAARDQPAEKDGKPVAPHHRPELKFEGTVTGGERRFASKHTYYGETLVLKLSPGVHPARQPCLLQQLVLSSARLEIGEGLPLTDKCIILTNAEEATFDTVADSFLISAGRVVIAGSGPSYSDVVARGAVRVATLGGSFVASGGEVTDKNGKKAVDSERLQNKFLSNGTKLLGVKFYATVEDGLTATAAKGVVTVSKLDEAKPFAKAGVKKGDVIETVNGEKVSTLHELDRLVCRATVSSGTARLKVKRGDRSEVIEVKLFDWSAYTSEK